MKKELIASLTVHVLVVLFVLFFRWPLTSFDKPDMIIPIEIATIGDITQSNKPTQAATPDPEPKGAPQKEEKPKEKPQPAPEPKPTPPLADRTPEKETKEAEKPVPQEAEPDETVVEEEETEEEDAEALPEEAEPEKPKPEPKPTPPSLPKPKPKAPKVDKKPEEKPKKAKKFDDVLKNILKTGGAEATSEKENETETGSDEGDDLPKGEEMTISERDALLQQMRKCWKVDVGAKNAKKFIIPVHLVMNPDATVKKAEALKDPQYENDPFYQAAVRQAMNAIRNPACAKLNLPREKYRAWKEFTFEFDPESMAY